MLRSVAWGLLFLSWLTPARAADLEPGVVRDVRVEGSVRLDRETILYYTTLRSGAPFSIEQAQADFRKLWETGLFEDLRLEQAEADGGVLLTWHVVERPLLARLSFSGNEGIASDEIQKNLKDKGIELREGSAFGLGQVERARVLVEEMFRDKGYRFAKIETAVGEDQETGGKTVAFTVDEGSKVRIARIEFEGNRDFSDDKLRGTFKKTKTEGFLCTFTKKCVFGEPNFKEDLERLNEHYYDRGYINFQAGEPDVESVGSGKSRRLHITVPVTEGAKFRVGKIDVEGNSAYPRDLLLRLNQLEAGAPFSRKKMSESRQSISEVYGVKGYFNVVIVPRFTPQADGDVVDVTYKITENDLYYVHRISFQGNTATKDKVIRRQLRIAEGDLFNTAAFKRSLFRIYQLGYFKEPEPKVEPSAEDPTRLDITINLQEEGRNDIRVGGGVSGVEGFFGTFAFSTRNLFGTGNSLTVDVQSGKRIKQYILSYLDPYILDRNVTGGIDLFNRYSQFTDFERRGTGGQVLLGYSFADFWALRTSYRYEDVDQEPRELLDENGVPIPIDPIQRQLLTDQRRVSSLQPVLSFSTVDNPLRPWRGIRKVTSLEYAGGFLGGTTNLIKPRIEATIYQPVSRRTNLAFHVETAWVKGFGGLDVPLFEKFFLGGEQSIRGYRVYGVGPTEKDSLGQDVLVGGDKMILFNLEYQIKIAEPLSFVMFADAGNAFTEDDGLSLSELKTSFGAEVRFWTPFLQAPLRLIYSYVPEPLVRNGVSDPKTDFTFSIGTTF